MKLNVMRMMKMLVDERYGNSSFENSKAHMAFYDVPPSKMQKSIHKAKTLIERRLHCIATIADDANPEDTNQCFPPSKRIEKQ